MTTEPTDRSSNQITTGGLNSQFTHNYQINKYIFLGHSYKKIATKRDCKISKRKRVTNVECVFKND